MLLQVIVSVVLGIERRAHLHVRQALPLSYNLSMSFFKMCKT